MKSDTGTAPSTIFGIYDRTNHTQTKREVGQMCVKLLFFCDPGGILTHDLQNRNLTFYTAELRGRLFNDVQN